MFAVTKSEWESDHILTKLGKLSVVGRQERLVCNIKGYLDKAVVKKYPGK